MRIPDELRECVCFIQAVWPSSQSGIGTAFFVAVPLEGEEHWFHYVVTAKHCIADVKTGPADTAMLLVNQVGGDRTSLRTRVSDWLLHETADVAVLPIGGVNPAFDVKVWPLDRSVATEEVVLEKNIGAGDDVFIAGLLVNHPGKTRNLPIVRLGSIAAMPEDPVERLATGPDVVTLVEVHSIGGLSGSPVFVHLSVLRDTPEGMFLVGTGGKAGSGGTSWLHGVMHGFYPNERDDPDGVGEKLNTGIAIVVRIDRVLDLIYRSDQVAMREEMKKHL
jgi:hypothetical protein